MAIHTRPIAERMAWLMELSQTHSIRFSSPEAQLARRRYLAEHDTALVALKCMDGRIHLPYVTRTPLGIIRPFRNLGGIFNLGWPYLGEMLADTVEGAVAQGRRVLVIITYHYSRGDRARGCAGFDCDRDAAFRHALEIKAQVEATYGKAHQTVYPLVCGFETDLDALILHSSDGHIMDLSAAHTADSDRLIPQLRSMFPDMPAQILRDLLPLVQGNILHINDMRNQDRQLDIEHREWVICVGRGFDFLHVPNIALIIGPYSPDLSHPIRQAAGIIRANMEQGRIPDDGFLLLSSSPYEEYGVDRARATMKSRFLAEFAAQVIGEAQPGLAARMVQRTAVLNWQTRGLEMLTVADPAPQAQPGNDAVR
jgi:hypothetical protein